MQWWSLVVRLKSRHPSGSTRRSIRPNYQHLHPRVCICAQPAICICLCAIYVGKFPGRFSYLSCRLKVAIRCRVACPLEGQNALFELYSSKLAVTIGKDAKSIKKLIYFLKRSHSRPFLRDQKPKNAFLAL